MKIKGKLVSLVITGVVSLGVVTTFVSVQAVKRMGNERVDEIQQTLMEERKNMLANLVNNAWKVTDHAYKSSQDTNRIAQIYQKRLNDVISVAYNTIAAVQKNMSNLPDDEQKQIALNLVKEMRYDGEQYLWINDNHPTMIMHPMKPELDGQDLSDFADPNGKKLFVEMVKVCRENGEGVVDYMWPKPGQDQPVPKLSYVKLFEPWGWIIGTGVYMEATSQEIMTDTLANINSFRYGKEGSDYFYTFSAQTRKMIQHPKASLIGTAIDDPIYTDPDGKQLLLDQLAVAQADGEGITSYKWAKLGEEQPVSKMTYIKYFKEWDWVICTGAYIDDIEKEIAAKSKEVTASVNTQIRKMISLAIVVCSIISIVTFLFSSKITKPINKASETLKDIAQGEGNLTVRLQIASKDEIGELSHWFNIFIEKLQTIIRQIAVHATSLAESSTNLTDTASQMVEGVSDMSSQSSTVASAARDMSGTMSQMASSTEELSGNIKSVASAVEEMTVSVNEIARSAEQASKVADEAYTLANSSNEKMNELGSAADQIGKVIEVIQDIAEQTNLLALNATIEAARAGDAGKGFAVVANEVKELARQTADATEDISQRIAAIQSSSGESVTAINRISEVIKNVNEVSRAIASAVEEQNITTREIAQNVAQSASAAEQVSSGVEQSSLVAREITQSIDQIDNSAQQNARGASKTQVAGSQLSQLSKELNSLVGQFKV